MYVVLREHTHTIFIKHNSILRSIWIHITQLMVSFWESAWPFVIIPLHSLISTIQYLAESQRDCGYVVNNPLSPIMSHPHSRNVCYFFSRNVCSNVCCLFFRNVYRNVCYFLSLDDNLFKVDFVSSCRLLNYCRGIFLRLDIKIADFASNLRRRLARGSLHFHTPCVFVVMRHVSRLTA